MQSIPRFASVLSLSFAFFAPAGATSAQASIQTPASASTDPKLEGLPTFLLPVPGGTVALGLTATELVDAACQTAFPSRPAMAPKTSANQVETAMRRSASMLGRVKVQVEPFLLARWPVKNSEYETFVARSRQPESGMKPVLPPFHWWRIGRKDDYEKRLAEINQRFPGNDKGPVFYWRQEGHELPYKLVNDRGDSIADHAVGNVSWIDANEFAASLGMRLPHEAEWTRAARGDRAINWPWGDPQDKTKDTFTGNESLKLVQLYSSRDQVPKPVGSVPAATGPFGHVDMFASIWQLVSEMGYYPINGSDQFAIEWKVLQKNKTGALLKAPPLWKDTKVVAKGGSYLSARDPIQLMIDQRAPMWSDDVLESLGFRLAKSLRPGYDTLYSRLRGVYNKAPFQPEQEIDLLGQAGAEHYELGDNGFPTSYQTVTFAPSSWLSKDKRTDSKKLFAASHSSPLLLGTLVTTEKIKDADVKGSIFTVLYRHEGMPRELSDAIKKGYKEVQAALKAAAKAAKSNRKPDDKKDDDKKDDDKKDDKKSDDKKKEDWRDVLRRYGLTEKDLEPKGSDEIDFVRIDGVVVKTDKGAFLLHGNEGKVEASIPAPNFRPATNQPLASSIAFGDDGDGKAIARFRFGVPLTLHNAGRVIEFHFDLPLETAAPTAEKPWRTPE